MLIRKTDINERRERLGNIENSKIFLCDRETGPQAFHNKTVATLMHNEDIKHALLIFEDSIAFSRSERIVKKIGNTLEGFNRDVEIDIFFQLTPEQMHLIREECT